MENGDGDGGPETLRDSENDNEIVLSSLSPQEQRAEHSRNRPQQPLNDGVLELDVTLTAPAALSSKVSLIIFSLYFAQLSYMGGTMSRKWIVIVGRGSGLDKNIPYGQLYAKLTVILSFSCWVTWSLCH